MIVQSNINKASESAPASASAYVYTAAAFIAVLPVLYYVYLIVTTCSDSLSNDYLAITPLISAVAGGGLKHGNFIEQFFYGVHFALVPVLVSAVNCQLFAWSPRAELLLGLLLAVVKTLLLWHCVKTKDRYGSATLLLLLSLVQFGGSQASVYLYGMTSICWGFVTTGFVLALWSLVKLKNKSLAMFVMLVGGLLSSYTEANVPPCWLALLIPIILWRPVRVWPFVVWFAGGLAGMAPYLYLAISKGAGAASGHANLFNFSGFVDLIGRLLLNNTVTICSASGRAQMIGCFALLLVVFLSWVIYKHREAISAVRVLTAASLIIYGLGSAYILAVFRTTIAPWYVALTSLLWCGVCILLVECFGLLFRGGINQTKSVRAARLLLLGFSLILAALYCLTNFSYSDKDWFRRSHSPSSQAVMRCYQFAPTYSIAALTAGELVDYETVIASLSEIYRHGWVANTKRQSCSLQGDFVLPVVVLHHPPNQSGLTWIIDRDNKKTASWDAPEHLNAYLPAKASVCWRVLVPEETLKAVLIGAVALPLKADNSPANSKLMVHITDLDKPSYSSVDHLEVNNNWTGFNIDLARYKGHNISITLIGASGDLVLRYPEIQFDLSQSLKPLAQKVCPSNLEGSVFYPAKTLRDLVFMPIDASAWHIKGLGPIDWRSSTFAPTDKAPSLIYAPALDIDVSQYSHFCIGLAAPASLASRNLCVQFTRNGTDIVQIIIPLIKSSEMQNYSYDLKLCDFKYGDRITGLTVMPVYIQPETNSDAIKIGTMRLTSRTQLAQ